MASSLSKPSPDVNGFNPSPFTLSNSTLRVNGHVILSQVPDNVTIIPCTTGCFLGFHASSPESHHVAPLGKLQNINFMSIFRFKKWWTTIWTGSNGHDLETETQFLLLQSSPTRPYVLFLPIIEGPFRASLQRGTNGNVSVCVESGSSHVTCSSYDSVVYLHAGVNPFAVVKEATRMVRAHLGGTFNLLEEKTPPGMVDKFGWCTWEEFYNGVREGLNGIVNGGCPAGFVLIDNGWQSITDAGGSVWELKEEFGTVEHVYVWHGLCRYREFSHLEAEGIDGVKVDAIHHLPQTVCENNCGPMDVAKACYKAQSASLKKHFKGNGVIASMEHCNNVAVLLGTEAISLARVGEDSWYADPYKKSDGTFWLQGCHMVHCAYNSLWMGNFIHPDWDMFQSTHPCAAFHAASRAISGGPIYISDTVGNHNFELLKTLVLPDGSILRCEHYALPTKDCLFDDPLHDGKTMLKIWNLNKYTGVLGVFNCQTGGWFNNIVNKCAAEFSQMVSTKTNPKDIEWDSGKNPISIEGVQLFAFYFSQAKKLILSAPFDGEEISLELFNFELITVSPVTVLPGKSVKFAPIGLVNMLNTGGAVQSLAFDEAQNLVEVGVRGTGEMRVYASERPSTCRIDGKEVDFEYEGFMVKIQVPWPGSSKLSMVQYAF